jgi:hypothetical protein
VAGGHVGLDREVELGQPTALPPLPHQRSERWTLDLRGGRHAPSVAYGLDRSHYHYLHPEVAPRTPAEVQVWNRTLSRPYKLAVIDNVTEAFAVFGYSSMDNDDIARWVIEIPKKIATKTGAAVGVIDHVIKDTGSRGRWAIVL